MELIHNVIPEEFLEALPAGIKYIARQGKDFLVVENLCCPKGHSLMVDSVRIHGEPAIKFNVTIGKEKGSFFLDAFWGSHKKLCDFFPSASGSVIVEAFCPVCGTSLMAEDACGESGCGAAKHIQLLLPGDKNRILVCGRLGCPGHRLEASGRIIQKISDINFFGTHIDDYFGGI
jgi:hypothetical protein